MSNVHSADSHPNPQSSHPTPLPERSWHIKFEQPSADIQPAVSSPTMPKYPEINWASDLFKHPVDAITKNKQHKKNRAKIYARHQMIYCEKISRLGKKKFDAIFGPIKSHI